MWLESRSRILYLIHPGKSLKLRLKLKVPGIKKDKFYGEASQLFWDKDGSFDAHQIWAKSFTCKNMQIVPGGVPGFIFDKEVVAELLLSIWL